MTSTQHGIVFKAEKRQGDCGCKTAQTGQSSVDQQSAKMPTDKNAKTQTKQDFKTSKLCPDALFRYDALSGTYHYTSIYCPGGTPSGTILVFNQKVITGCDNAGGPHCRTKLVPVGTYDFSDDSVLTPELKKQLREFMEERYGSENRPSPAN